MPEFAPPSMLLSLVDIALTLGAVILAVPCAVFVVECLVALLPGRREREPRAPARPLRKAVLMPAHNEEAVIATTLRNVLPQLGPGDRCVVVADNCSDRTAEIVRAHGAIAIERSHPTDRGKGFALAFGLDHLAQDPPDVVIIVDADCELSEGALELLARRAVETDRPVQADYLLVSPAEPTPMSVVSALAFLVRNRVRPLGLFKLGLPCHLTGTGMAFTWDVIRKAPPTGAYLVEDLLMGLDLALLGHAPLYTGLARVTSLLPERDEAAKKQRTRWEHGQLTTVMIRGPKLIAQGLTRGKLGLMALGLDLIVPPLALLVMLLGAALVTTLVAFVLGASVVPLQIVAASLALLGVCVLGSWARFARTQIPLKHLAAIPLYVLWKIPVYISYLVRGREKTWQRTERTAKEPPPSP